MMSRTTVAGGGVDWRAGEVLKRCSRAEVDDGKRMTMMMTKVEKHRKDELMGQSGSEERRKKGRKAW